MSDVREELQDARTVLDKIDKIVSVQTMFEQGLALGSLSSLQKDVRLLATRRATLDRIRTTIAAWQESEN